MHYIQNNTINSNWPLSSIQFSSNLPQGTMTKTLVSYFFSFLGFLRIIPNRKNKVMDNIALILWTTVAIVSVVDGWINLSSLTSSMSQYGILNTILGVSAVFMAGFVVLLGLVIFPLLSYFGRKFPMLVKSNSLPTPTKLLLFTAIQSLILIQFVQSLQINLKALHTPLKNVSIVMNYGMMMFSNSIFILTVGVSAEIIMRKSLIEGTRSFQKGTASKVQNCLKIVAEFKALKQALSPMLLVVLTGFTTFSIGVAFSFFDGNTKITASAVVGFLQIIMVMAYTCLSLGDCHSIFQTMASNLR